MANILLVDDNPENLMVLRAILEELGENLVTAQSGEDALKCLLEQDFAAILLDVRMTGMDGFETASMIKERERNAQTPIIFITAYDQTDAHIFKGYSVGAIDYMFKPIMPEILRAKVAAFVELFEKTEKIKHQAALIESANRELEARFDQINRLNREMAAVNHELESFSYSVSHDLRAPLRSISGFSQALMTEYHDQLDPQAQEYLEWIQASCQRMGELIDDLLQLSRLTSVKMNLREVNLSAVAEAVVDNLRMGDSKRKINVVIQPDLIADGDERLLRIVLENLLGNAWKFTGSRPDARIELGCADNTFYVSDNGAGFNMEYADQLFKPFQRLHDEDQFEGNGIGLVTVQRIIHRHGGRIWAKGSENEGATFYFTLGE